MGKKVKKPSYRKLQQELELCKLHLDETRDVMNIYYKEKEELRRKLVERVDTTMLQERIRLANALGQMINSVTEAVKFVIGKEVM